MLRVSRFAGPATPIPCDGTIVTPEGGSPSCQPPVDPVPLQCNGQIIVDGNSASCQPTAGPLHLYHVMEPLLLRRAVVLRVNHQLELVPLQCNGQIIVDGNSASCQPTAGPATPIPCDGTIVTPVG